MEISQIDPLLYLGAAKHVTRNTEQFQKLNIDVIINCCNDITHKNTHEYIIEQYPIDDGIDGTLIHYMDAAADKINYYLNQGKKIYVHCVHGRSRSPAILIYYFMKHQKLTYQQAFEKILSIRPIIWMNSNFVEELKYCEKIELIIN